MKKLIKKIPVVRDVAAWLYINLFRPSAKFKGSQSYWQERYTKGGNSGEGSYAKLAVFKSEFINDFVKSHQVRDIIELGCGDGNQLKYADYPKYHGFDVSEQAVEICRSKFSGDDSKTFDNLHEFCDQRADLLLSLDVIYHLVEDSVYTTHMDQLFKAAKKYVIIYSSNTNQQNRVQSPHVRHRKFTEFTNKLADWECVLTQKNKYPYKGDTQQGSFADFYVFRRID